MALAGTPSGVQCGLDVRVVSSQNGNSSRGRQVLIAGEDINWHVSLSNVPTGGHLGTTDI